MPSAEAAVAELPIAIMAERTTPAIKELTHAER